MPRTKGRAYGYLKEGYRRRFTGEDGDALQKKAFQLWLREKAAAPGGAGRYTFTSAEWAKFGNGEVTAAKNLDLLQEFLADKGVVRAGERIFEPCPPPDRRGLGVLDICGFGWITFSEWLERTYLGPTYEPCGAEADLEHVARFVLVAISRFYTPAGSPPRDEEAAIAHAEAEVRMPRAELLATLREWWRACPNSVWFVLGDVGGRRQRVGASVVLPVTPEAAGRFRAGGLENTDFARADVACPSRHLMTFASVTVSCPKRLGRYAYDYARMNTIMRQMAVLLPPLQGAETPPDVLAFAGSPECSRMLKDYGFVEQGVFTPRRRHPVMLLETSELMSGIMLSVMKEYQRRHQRGL